MNITLIIIIITAFVSYIGFQNATAFYKLKFNASLINHNKQYYRFFSYGFVHADWMHLLVNMFVLFSFGTAVENSFAGYFSVRGPFYFLLLYFGGLGFSTLPAFSRHKNNDYYNAVGASGAVSAVLFSAIIMNPQMSIVLLFLPIPTPAWIFGILYLIYSAYMAKRGTDNVGHDAHFWGAVFGLIFTIALNPAFVRIFFEHFLN
jgi:membrane associated rhomboid family serine protease